MFLLASVAFSQVAAQLSQSPYSYVFMAGQQKYWKNYRPDFHETLRKAAGEDPDPNPNHWAIIQLFIPCRSLVMWAVWPLKKKCHLNPVVTFKKDRKKH